ncbi:MAG: hypothetical protein GXO22_03085 [Aquificae bacterium]|nr:hypothetical protein [Aquificota bacterium]
MEEEIYVEVAIPIAQYKTFTYKIPLEILKQLDNKELIGRRVLVPFRNTGFTGIIIDHTKKPSYQVKPIEEIPDKDVVFTKLELDILKKLSNYYVSPLGLTVNFFLPDVLNWKKKQGRWIKTVKEEKIYIPTVVSTTGIQKLSLKALELLEFILERGEVTRKEIVEFGFSVSSLKTLIKKGLVKEEKFLFREATLKARQPTYLKEEPLKDRRYLYSFDKQIDRIKRYLPIIYSQIKEKKDVFLIFPSVRAVDYVYSFLRKHFADKVFVYHDGISGKQKIETWFNFRKYFGTILVGTFSGALVPTDRLGLIILEDESSDSYKALRVPRFDTRRVVLETSNQKGSILLFASTISSVESYYLQKTNFFKNFQKWKIPDVELQITPLNKEKLFTEKIITEIEQNQKVLIIANKKAYASFLYCVKCEEEITCPNCEIPLKIYSKPQKYLRCELCNQKYQYLKYCPTCHQELIEIGFGIERIEEILNRYFKNQISYLEASVDTKIKLATSIVDKELLIPDFELILNIYPDFLLNINDFRGNERYFKNIYLGIFKAQKKYILVTNSIKNIAVKALEKKIPSIFYEKELYLRKEFELPPYTKLILLTFEKRNLDIETVEKIFKNWILEERITNINYKGAFFAYYPYMRGKTRIQIILKNFKNKQKLIQLYEKCRRKGIKLIIDIDPKQII